MTNNKVMTTTFLGIIAAFSIFFVGMEQVFAEEESKGYKYADGITPILTFTFKDGIETHEFPIFVMTNDYISDGGVNQGSPSFEVIGIVANAPHLHKALDEAFKYKQSGAHEYDYQLFEVDVDFMKDGSAIRTLAYHDCKVSDYKVITLLDDQESYMSSKTGFAVVDEIEFICGGLNPSSPSEVEYKPDEVTDYGANSYDYYQDIRTIIDFEFDQGIERIDIPFFKLLSGFEEEDDNVTPSFEIETLIGDYPMLQKAVDNARKIKGITSFSNIDFEAHVKFVKESSVLRALDFKDCRVVGYQVETLFDKEDGFTGKSGFSPVEQYEIECIGIEGVNPQYSEVYGSGITWKTDYLSYTAEDPDYSLADGLGAIVTFEFDNGKETAVFPIFNQIDVLGQEDTGTTTISVAPSFELGGQIVDLPMLYDKVDENLRVTSTTGANNFLELFGVTVELVYDNGEHTETLRGFEYNDCRVTDYNLETERDKEDGYFKGFANTNMFDFECLGYHPYDPMYDKMFEYDKPTSVMNSVDYQAEQLSRSVPQPLFG